jgi:hypothetical protein
MENPIAALTLVKRLRPDLLWPAQGSQPVAMIDLA